MWTTKTNWLVPDRVQKIVIQNGLRALSFAEVIELLRDDESFRACFNQVLVDSRFAAFRWETPPVTSESIDRDFEFVLIKSSGLDRPVDVTAFDSHFRNAKVNCQVVTFQNLGGDAILVVPCPSNNGAIYAHLGGFVRSAADEQIHEFWNAVAVATECRISQKPLWLSTAGMGVAWLHVRLDDRPKYYAHRPYTQVS